MILFIILAMSVAVITWFIFNHFLKNEPNSGSVNPVAAEYKQRLGSLKKHVEQEPKSAKAHSDYAVALYATGDTQGAKSEYEKAIEFDSKNATTFNNLGNAYRDLNQIDKAIESYDKAISLNPKLANPYYNLASIQQYNRKNIDQAIQTYQSGLKALPNNEQMLLSLALAYEAKSDKANAEKVYRSILTINANNAAAKVNLERLTN